MNQLKQHEYPHCNKCGMKKLNCNEVIICPACDTASEPSGIVSKTKDPGVGGFKEVVIKGPDGKDHKTMVAVESDDEPELVELQTAPPAIATGPISADEVKQRPGLLLQALRLVFEQRPAKTMAEFKSLKKVRDQIDKLEFMIQNIKGE